MKSAWAFVCILVLSLCVSEAVSQERRLEVLNNARIRSEPNDTSSIIAYALAGARAPILDQSENGQWYKIKYRETEGWIHKRLTSLLPILSPEEMFAKQDTAELRPSFAIEAEKEPIKYARARRNNVIIGNRIDPRDPNYIPLHTTRGRDEVFILVHYGDQWCWVYVEQKDSLGVVRCNDIEILDELPQTSSLLEEARGVFIGLGTGGAVILLIVVIVAVRRGRASRTRNVYVQKNVLIIAKEQKTVQSTLTNAVGPIDRCFSELGLNVSTVKDSVVARNSIEHNMPDLILVDWNFEPAIFSKLDNLFARMSSDTLARTYLLFFNVPDLSNTPKSKTLRNVSFLGLTISDRDIFNVVTPLLTQYDPSQDAMKSAQHCALEGEIDGGNLLEVLQFIEIGSRTGCLMIETKGPFGLIYFGDGRIIYAATKERQGVEAVYAVLNQPTGKFRFIANKQPKVANLNLPTLSVLMEWTKEKDEARR